MTTQTRIPVTRQRRTRQSGSAMIEAALSLTAFLWLTFGVMEFSMAVYAYNFCAYGARDGARWASVRGSHVDPPSVPVTADDVKTFVANEAVGLASSNLTVTTTWLPDNNPGSQVQVQVSYNVIPLVGMTIASGMNVSSTATYTIVH